MIYEIIITPTALNMLKSIQTGKREKIENRIDALKQDPEKQCKPLLGQLSRFRSVHAAWRYRVIYHVNRGEVLVIIVAAGIRKEGDSGDIYNLAKKLFRSGLLGFE